jgi:hypothetical protein
MSLLTVVDLVITFLLAETALLVVWRLATGRGLAVGALLPMMAAGGFILLALHFALDGGSAWAILVCLAFSGVAHALDLRRRLVLAAPAPARPPASSAGAVRSAGGQGGLGVGPHWGATRQ